MNKDTIDNISEALGELFEKLQNTITQYAAIQLSKNMDDPKKWYELQKKQVKDFKRAVSKITDQFKSKINEPIDNAFSETYKEAKSDLEDVKEGKFIPTNKEKEIKAFKLKVAIDLNNLNKSTLDGFKKIVDNVGNTIYRKKITSGDDLYKQINQAMNTGISDMFKIYKDGRKVSFKAYEEMNVRTTMHHEAQDYQIQSSSEWGVAFYLCSSHGDCANDHAEFQGKIYVDKNWKSIIPKEKHKIVSDFISSKKILFLQDVRDGKPYLTTRPNCRHYLKPLTLEQAMGNSVDELLTDFKMKKGKYDSEKYKNLQMQRKFERQVRAAKQEKDKFENMLSKTKNEETKKLLTQKIQKSSSIVRKNQKQLVSLIRKNPYLERDYRRENYKTIVQDVGYKYRKDIKS